MILSKRSIAVAVLLLTGISVTAAQPTCFTNYPASSYCDFSRYPVIFLGRVRELIKADKKILLPYKQAKVEVYRTLKGPAQPKMLTIELPVHCAGSIDLNEDYIFNLGDEFHNTTWSKVKDTFSPWTSEVLAGLEDVLSGKHQPVLSGEVVRPDSHGFAGLDVIAKSGDREVRTKTDAAGRYTFEKLEDGRYSISVDYPKGYGPVDEHRPPKEREVHEIDIEYHKDRPCGARINFNSDLSAKVTGTLQADRAGNEVPYFRLIDVKTLHNSFQDGIDSYSYPPEGGGPGPVGFSFIHVPPGRYILKAGFDRSWDSLNSFYYPGVRSVKDAKVIEIGMGSQVELEMKLPPVDSIKVSGGMYLPDGEALFGGVMLVDAEAPDVSDSFSPADHGRDDIQFSFKASKGRRYYLCAAYDGKKTGARYVFLRRWP